MKIVDIHRKEIVYRKAVAKAIIEVEERERTREVLEEELKNVAEIAERGVRTAWLHIPLLHPLPITRIELEIGQVQNTLEIICTGETYYRTGIEMDVLFGVACAVSYIFHLLDGKAIVKEISVLEKVKRCLKEDIDDLDGTMSSSLEISLNMSMMAPDTVRTFTCEGCLCLRRETVERILSRNVEKGDPLAIGEIAALENCKRYSEIVGEVYHILNARVRTEVLDSNMIKLLLQLKSIESSWGPAIHGTLSGLIAMWDVVKKYEKDKEGQYPYTRIINVRPITISDS